MKQLVLVGLVACGSEPTPPAPPDGGPGREHDVLVEVSPGAPHILFRDGDGAWRRALELGPGRYGFDLEAQSYGLAVICGDEFRQHVQLTFSTLAEQADVAVQSRCGMPTSVDGVAVSGTLRGLDPDGGYRIGGSFLTGMGGFTGVETAYSYTSLPGTQSLIYASVDADNGVDRFVIQREVVLLDDRVIDIDFSTEATAGVKQTVGVGGSPDFKDVEVEWIAADGGRIEVSTLAEPERYAHPAAEHWRAGDRLELRARMFDLGTNQVQRATIRAMTPGDIRPSIPRPAPAVASVTAGAGGLVAQWDPYPGAEQFTVGLFSSDSIPNPMCFGGACSPSWRATVSAGSLVESRSLVVFPTIAELQALEAWDDRLALPGPINWSADATGPLEDGEFQSGQTGELAGPLP